jgi:hypothetical protein
LKNYYKKYSNNFFVIFNCSIHATCFHPEALQLIVGAGDKVLVYDASDGNLIDTLKGKNKKSINPNSLVKN